MREAKLSFEGRRFRLWAFVVSHSQLLFRSPKSKDADTRIDVVFRAVTALCLPSRLKGLKIEEVDVSSVPEISGITNEDLLLDRSVYRVTGTDGISGFVVCGG